MKAVNLLRASALGILLAAHAPPAHAQTEIGAQVDLFSSYVWRGLTLTNKPVAQPDVWVSFPAGNASITLGSWANIDLGQYDDPENDISESGGLSAFNLAEYNPYAEVAFGTGKSTLTGGVVAYIYPNDLTATSNGGLNSDLNTWEAYGKVGFDVPLAPEFSVYYDFDKIKGFYFEGAVSHSLSLGRVIRSTWAGSWASTLDRAKTPRTNRSILRMTGLLTWICQPACRCPPEPSRSPQWCTFKSTGTS